jgi:nonribosomal peptide synthetase DhbF
MLQAFFEEPLPAACTGLRRVICSGEALSAEAVSTFYRKLNAPLHNLYGPTEAAVDVSYRQCREAEDNPVPIGRTCGKA